MTSTITRVPPLGEDLDVPTSNRIAAGRLSWTLWELTVVTRPVPDCRHIMAEKAGKNA
ncbi:hypothetical protein OHB12_09175 [Nocardia sp. NBC_01730]|uniref:hypothetical protein n=1 Tax=Nocardia sp. NBC_01730 TaxID=2975998 RepID=UPI002E0E8A90|nr:hypothetical protein OHB12_09175 [Nocardia sp. NBC_01730]